MTHDAFFAANRDNWDDRVPVHVASRSYDIPGFLAGRSTLEPFEVAEVGDVRGKSLLHLQCHFGMDTLSWARLGARVTGLDFSPNAIQAARKLAADAGIDARFVEANLYDAPTSLAGEQFDVVFTGIGALCWLPDVRRWAATVAACLAPGGVFYIREGHPVLWAADDEIPDPRFVLRYPYFERAEPTSWDESVTYTDNDEGIAIAHTRTFEWNHGLGEIVTALIDAGLRIEFLHEFDFVEWQALPWMLRGDDGMWRLPPDHVPLPLTYSIRTTKTA